MASVSALVLTLALLAQDPTAQPAETPAVAPAAAEAAEPPLPSGAPEDDYGLVNWCWGALNAHMGLYPRVRDQLDPSGYPADEQQMEAGRAYLALYEQAIRAADLASPTARASTAAGLRNAGANVFAGSENVERVQLKWAYLGWSLPGRCETAARRMLASSELMAPALRTSTTAAAGIGAPRPEETPPQADAITAEPVEPAAAPSADPAAEPVPQR